MSANNRYHTLFERLSQRNEGAFVPFVTIGDPDLEQSEKIIRTLIDAGADALELGLPFSDPVADGPVIQAANFRALASGVRVADCFALLKRIRNDYPDIPMGLLVYGNLVWSPGIDNFYQQVAAAGVDSVLIADVPVRSSNDFTAAAEKHGVCPIFIAPPDGSEATLNSVAAHSKGYIYLLSRSGVTGANDELNAPATKLIDALKSAGGAPALLGFGISRPEHVRAAIDAGAAGAISGSAVVRLIEDNLEQPNTMLEMLAAFVSQMKSATR